VVKLRYAFGSAYPLLANQTSEVLDPLNYWWGLTWSPLLDLDKINPEQEQKFYVDFQKAQYSLLHVLSENFGMHEKPIIADHDPVQLVEKLKTKYLVEWNAKLEFFPDKPRWTPTHWMTTWLPFGYMCLHNVAAKYVDTGVTDAITKHDAYVASKTFTPYNITKWVSTVEDAVVAVCLVVVRHVYPRCFRKKRTGESREKKCRRVSARTTKSSTKETVRTRRETQQYFAHKHRCVCTVRREVP
jgi:hypothetical protein